MAIKMVRQPSETPNINNVDDFIPFRYAYSNQDGYVKGKGSEFSYTINGNIFRINSGRAVVQGVEVDIDANGYEIVVDNISSKRYHTIYLEVNLALMTIEIKQLTDSGGFPFIEESDDLTENSTGIARLILYGFESYQGVISGVVKGIKRIKYTEEITVNNSTNSYNINNLNIMRDNNDVIVLEDVVIPQMKLLWSGSWREDNNNLSFSGLKLGDEIEIEYDIVNSDGNNILYGTTRTAKFVLNSYINGLYIQSLGYPLEATDNSIVGPQIINSYLSVNVPESTDSNTTISRESKTFKTYMSSSNSSGTNPTLNVSYNIFLVINKIYKIIK